MHTSAQANAVASKRPLGWPSRTLAELNGRPLKDQKSGIRVTNVGLLIPDLLPFEEWKSAGMRLSHVASTSAWCMGDWLCFGQERYPDRYARAIEAAGLDYQTLRNYAWVARRFDHKRRHEGLSFQHHAEVASLTPDEQEHWLTLAEEQGWSRNRLRKSLRAAVRPSVDADRTDPTLPQIKVSRSQFDLWLTAAQRADMELEVWVVETLTGAAHLKLGDV